MDIKTLWMGNIESYMDEPYLRNFFSDEEGLSTIKIIKDKNTGVPAGYAFVEFFTPQNAKVFLEKYNNRPMPGSNVPFRLNWASYSGGKTGTPEFSIFVGDIASDATETQITQAFRLKFPSALGLKIVTDPISGHSKGYGFMKFSNEREANLAIDTMQGVYIGSKPIRVSKASSRGNPVPTTNEVESVSQPTQSMTGWSQYGYQQQMIGYNADGQTTQNQQYGMYPAQAEAYEYHQRCYSSFNVQNEYPQVYDVNFFVRQHDTYTDNSTFVTERVSSLLSDLTCTSFTKIQK